MKGTSIIVIRRNRQGDLRGSRPCSDCCRYIKTMGIKNIYYSTDDGDFIIEKAKLLENDHLSLSRRMANRNI